MQTVFNKIFIIAFVLMMLASCGNKQPITATVDDAVRVRTQPVMVKNNVSKLQYSGKIESSSQANLSFKVGGIISRIYVKEGDAVSRGQLLAVLDMTEINAQVQQAKQAAEKAGRDFTRMKNLLADTAATLEQFQNAQTGQNMAGEALRIASFNQQYAQIRATDNGTVIKKVMNEGELASPGAPVLMLNATSSNNWVVRFGVSDKDWAALQKGQTASVQIDAYPAETFTGIINKIAAAADAASGTYEIEVKVLPNGKKFAAGLFATVQLSTSSQHQIAEIPIEALTEGDGKTGYVYLLNKGDTTVSKRKVIIAYVDNDKVVISSGLEDVSNVITDGVSYLTEDTKVKVAPSP